MPFHNLYTNEPNACSLFRYVKKNTRCHSLYRGHNPDLPRFRWNRPKEVVSHCLSSITGADDILLKDVKMISKGKFEIRTPRDKRYYELTFREENVQPACHECVSWQRTRLPCNTSLLCFNISLNGDGISCQMHTQFHHASH